jgi:hypothetical protein
MGFLSRLRDVPPIREHGGSVARNGKESVRSGEPAEVAHVRQMRDQQALNAPLLHLAAQPAQPGWVIHLLRYIRCLLPLTRDKYT